MESAGPLFPARRPPGGSRSWRASTEPPETPSRARALPRSRGRARPVAPASPAPSAVGLRGLLAERARVAKLRAFYHEQNAFIDELLSTDNVEHIVRPNESGSSALGEALLESPDPGRSAAPDAPPASPRAALLMNASLAANVALLVLKVLVAVLSGSMAVLASALDSFMDIFSGVILWWTSRAARRTNKYVYPVGKTRMQPLGIVAFACVMGTMNFYVVLESCKALAAGARDGLSDSMLLVGVSMGGVILAKLALWLACRASDDSAVQVYAQDHLNDTLTNGVGLVGATAAAAARGLWSLDPVAALAIATWVAWGWGTRAKDDLLSLVGTSPPPRFLQKVTYMAVRHDTRIRAIDTVRAYTLGEGIFVEVDLLLDRDLPLHEAHDIGEALQIRLELLDEVERAFVHLDYEVDHQPEHGREPQWGTVPGWTGSLAANLKTKHNPSAREGGPEQV